MNLKTEQDSAPVRQGSATHRSGAALRLSIDRTDPTSAQARRRYRARGTAHRVRQPGDWQGEEEGAPHPEFALDPDAAAVRADNAASDGETQSGPSHAARAPHMPESIENVWQVLGRDAGAAVANPDRHIVDARRCTDGHRRAART